MHRLTNDDIENEILQQFIFGHNIKYLSEFYNIPALRIHRILKRKGINKVPRNMLDITKDDEKKICELYNKGFSTIDISEVFYKDKIKCDRTVANILTKNNMKLRKIGKESSVTNKRYFQYIDTENKAYFLGFIYADGNIIKSHDGYNLQFDISRIDSYILDKLIKDLEYYEYIKDYDNEIIIKQFKKIRNIERENRFNNYNKKYIGSRLTITCKEIYMDLMSHGICENKTLNIILPTNIPNNLLNHFIRGFFDGDGCFSSKKITFYGQYNMLEYIKNILDKFCIGNNNIFIKKESNVCMLTYGAKKDVKAIYNYMYSNCNICLNRKFEKMSIYVNTEVTRNSTVERSN